MVNFSFSKVCVHDGKFHVDDVLAVSLLKLFGFEGEVVRTRDPKEWETPDTLAVDVSGAYDGIRFFDHHQDGSPSRDEYYSLEGAPETPYCAAGLLWKHIGRQMAQRYGVEDGIDKFFKAIDEEIIMPVDFYDNGVDIPVPCGPDDPLLYRMISSINDDDPMSKDQDRRFEIAVHHLTDLLSFYFERLANQLMAESEIKIAFDEAVARGSRYVRISPNHQGWKSVLQSSDDLWEKTSNIRCVIGARGEEFAIIMMPKTRESWTDMRFRLPQSLKEEFSEFTFIHKNGFMGVLKNLDRIDEIIGKLEKM